MSRECAVMRPGWEGDDVEAVKEFAEFSLRAEVHDLGLNIISPVEITVSSLAIVDGITLPKNNPDTPDFWVRAKATVDE